MVDSLLHKTGEKQLKVARGIVEALSNKAFRIMIVNTLKLSVSLPKNMEIGKMTEAQSTVVPTKGALTVGPVNVLPIYRGIQNKEQQFS